jgi:hypothetical protein
MVYRHKNDDVDLQFDIISYMIMDLKQSSHVLSKKLTFKFLFRRQMF